jgi:regulator of protease activity HflC (stomatin/prohibitin superfamily)
MKRLGLAAAAFFGLLALASSLYTVSETEQAIITQFGEPVGTPKTGRKLIIDSSMKGLLPLLNLDPIKQEAK